jgi:hypothetical protein
MMTLSIKNPPEPKIERISALISKIQAGDIKIPKFQRGFVWDEEDIIKLLESIYEGYPIASLLFWLSDKPMKSERSLGGFELPPTPEKYPRNYVLDGQQRLTTIYGVLNWPDPKKLNKLNVYFDLENQRFHHYSGEDNVRHIPMNILFNTSAFFEFHKKWSGLLDEKELISNAYILLEIFREYLMPVVTIKEKTVEDVCPIFERINSSGVHLDVFDLMVAATWTDNFDLNDKVVEIRESTKLKDFERLDNTTYLKIMSVIHGFGSKRDNILKLRELSPERLIELAKIVQESVEKAVDFLSTDLAVPSDAFLPYENQLVVFSYFFSRIRSPSSAQLEVLRKWFWQSGFSEHYRGAAEGILEQDINAADQLIEGDLEALKLPFGIYKKDLLTRQFAIQGSFSKTFAVMLARKNPMNITNGSAIDTQNSLSVYNSKEFHHIFPADFLKDLRVDKVKRNNLCNICMLSASQNKYISKKAPSLYLNECANTLGEKAEGIFNSNVIPFGSDAPWVNDDYDGFLEIRADLIIEEIKRLW